MQTSASAASTAASTRPAPFTRRRFILRADGGFLQANHKLEGPPVTTTRSPESATHYVDFTSAARRGAAFQQLGWRNLRVVEVAL